MIKKIITLTLLFTGLIIFLFFKYSKNNNLNSGDVLNTEKSSEEVFVDVVPPEIKTVDTNTSTFIHKKYNFSFNYPSSLKTSNFREGDGEQIVLQNDKDWFQVYITPWDEGGTLSVARIKKDLPNLLIQGPQEVILGPKQKDGVGPHAVIFFSKDSGLGETREVWFVYDGNLYQITTYKRLDSVVGQVLSTLVFD